MARQETNIGNRIAVALSQAGSRLFRNNRGLFLSLDGKRKQRAGLEPNGASDYIGWTPITITDDMVGKRVAVFTAIEVKKPTGYATKDQVRYINTVTGAGGIAGVARSESDALRLVDEVRARLSPQRSSSLSAAD